MNWSNEWKIVCTTILTGVLVYFRIIAIPIFVLLVFMILDYFTGLISAWINCELSSRMGITGIIKKVMYLVLIAVGIGADWVINFGLSDVGIEFECGYLIGLLITIWLILNELMSILENIGEINGNTYPKFIKDILSHIKKAIDNKAGEEDEKNSGFASGITNSDK